eukprot:3560143-Pleurochrysis_carterae.AAC.1
MAADRLAKRVAKADGSNGRSPRKAAQRRYRGATNMSTRELTSKRARDHACPLSGPARRAAAG